MSHLNNGYNIAAYLQRYHDERRQVGLSLTSEIILNGNLQGNLDYVEIKGMDELVVLHRFPSHTHHPLPKSVWYRWFAVVASIWEGVRFVVQPKTLFLY